MMRATFGVLMALGVLASGALTGLAIGQSSPSARDEGRRLATEIAERARVAATTPPDASRLPNFTTAPPVTDLFDHPDAIAAQAAAATHGNEGYAIVRSSIAHRPVIAAQEVRATVARAKAIAVDAEQYVGGTGVGGTSGSCRQLPPSAAGAIPYEATCNVGVALEQRDATCAIPLRVSVTPHTAYRYWCDDDGDACAPFDNQGCRATGTHPGRCLQGFTRNGQFVCTEPGNPVRELLCPTLVSGAVLRGTETTNPVDETWDDSACRAHAEDASCTSQAERCTEAAPATRTIDGIAVTRDCWARERSYRCSARIAAQDCDALEHDARCRFEREDCLTEETPCPTRERVYRCTAPDGPTPAPQYICDGDVYCLGGECETIERQPNTEFKDAAVALHAAADAGKQFDPATLRLFKGTRETCHSAVFGILNCCAGKAFSLIPYGQLLVLLGCNREEILLHERDNQGLCAYVGSYCSASVLGVCITKKKAYCCFESKLSRILQEQGRMQLGKRWAAPKSERCDGFTADEFARLDLSRMDFSEVYAEFQNAAKLPEELSTSQALQQRIADYYRQAQPR